MGKITIVSEQGAGEYTASLSYDLERFTTQLAALTTQQADLEISIAAQIVIVSTDESLLNDLQDDLSAAINANAQLTALTNIVASMQKPAAKLGIEQRKLQSLRLGLVTAQKQHEWLTVNVPATAEITVWCADYTEGLTGEVGTAEVMAEPTNPPIIQPGTITGIASAYDQTRDYIMQPAISSGGAAVYYNRAFLPAWQKYKPTYRIGIISTVSGDLCDLTLDQALSIEQGLNVNQTATLAAVPIEYMTGNGAVFEPNDRVLIKFDNQDWSQPKVIGFETNPRPELLIHLMESGESNTNNNLTLHCERYNPDGSYSGPFFNYGGMQDYFGGIKRRKDTGAVYFSRYNGEVYKDGGSLGGHGGAPSYVLQNGGPFGVNASNIFVASIVDGTTGNDSNILRRLSLTAQHQSVLNIGYGSASEPVSIRYIFATDTFLVLNVFFGSGATEKNILAIHNLDGSIDTQIADYGTDIFSTRPSGIVACVSNDENRWYGLDFTTGNIKIADLENKIMLADISSGLGAQAKIYSMGATKHALVCIEGGNSAIVELQHPVIKIHIWDIDQTTGAYVKRPDNGANLRADFFATENNCFLIG